MNADGESTENQNLAKIFHFNANLSSQSFSSVMSSLFSATKHKSDDSTEPTPPIAKAIKTGGYFQGPR